VTLSGRGTPPAPGPGSEKIPARAPSRGRPGFPPLYIAARTSQITLRDGSRVLLRPAVPADRALLVEAFERLSPESRYRRFFAPIQSMSGSLLDYLTAVDYVDHFAWAAISAEPGLLGEPYGVGVSRYVRLADPAAAEMAVTVVDDWQGKGLGRILLDALVLEALENGIERFEGDVLVENRPMQEMLRRTGARFRPEGNGVLRFSIDLPARDGALSGSPFTDLLRALAKGEVSLYQHEPCPWLSGVTPSTSGPT
jgi:RimJ/RimL family protein N-acetyltransferase